MFVIFALKDESNRGAMGRTGAGPFFPLALFFLIFGLGACFGFETGYAINLARDFGPRLMSYAVGYGHEVWSAGEYYFWSKCILGLSRLLVTGTCLAGRILWGEGRRAVPHVLTTLGMFFDLKHFSRRNADYNAVAVPMVASFLGCTFGGFLYDLFIYTGPESPINTPWLGLKRLSQPQNLARRKESSAV